MEVNTAGQRFGAPLEQEDSDVAQRQEVAGAHHGALDRCAVVQQLAAPSIDDDHLVRAGLELQLNPGDAQIVERGPRHVSPRSLLHPLEAAPPEILLQRASPSALIVRAADARA